MTEVYDGTEYPRERREKQICLGVWLAVLVLILGVSVGLYVYYVLQPYQWPGRVPLFWTQIAIVTVAGWASLFFYAMVYRRRRAYCKVLRNVRDGIREISTGEYLGVSGNIEVKEGVEFYVLLVMEFNERRQIYFERKVLLDAEKEIPVFHEGEILHFVTQANMLCSYEVLPRPEDEPTMEEKRRRMVVKDKERLFDNVILDEEAARSLKKKKRRRVRFEDAPLLSDVSGREPPADSPREPGEKEREQTDKDADRGGEEGQ